MRKEFDEGLSDASYAMWRSIWKIGIPLVLFLVIVGGLFVFIAKPFQVVDKVTNPDRMIYTYEHFHDLHQKVIATDTKIANKESQIDQFIKTTPEGWRSDMSLNRDYQRMNTELAGLREFRANIVAEYNANSAKVTRSFLKDGSLPERLN